MALKSLKNLSTFAVVAGLALGLSACGGFDGVQLNGKVFDAIGLNTGSVRSGDPRMKERAPLVVPPGLEAGLPTPGSGASGGAPDLGIVDADAGKNKTRADLERQQAEYCAKNYDAARALGDDTVNLAKGPLGDCRPSVLSAIGGINKSEESDDAQ